MPSDDLIEHAKSSTDYYQLLGIDTESSPTDIQRAYRKSALKYHPDKAHKDADPQAVADKFHLLKIASEVLSDPSAKAIYDQARAAKVLKRQNDEALSGFKRKMKEDLEQREEDARQRSGKRPYYGTEDTTSAQQRHLQELAREGEQRRKEQTEAKRKAMFEAKEQFQKNPESVSHETPDRVLRKTPTVDEEDGDTIQVRWSQKGFSGAFDESYFFRLFEKYGKIENVIVRRKKGREGRNSSGRAMIVFASSKDAHKAVEDSEVRPDGITAVRLASQNQGKAELEDFHHDSTQTGQPDPRPEPTLPHIQSIPLPSKSMVSPTSENNVPKSSSILGSSKGKSSEMDVLARLRLAAKKKAAGQNSPAQEVAGITTQEI